MVRGTRRCGDRARRGAKHLRSVCQSLVASRPLLVSRQVRESHSAARSSSTVRSGLFLVSEAAWRNSLAASA